MAIGDETVTPLSGVSLEDLANGDGPARAWLQYFNVSLDLRAIANTIYLLRKRDEADRELQKPFGHAPRMSDLASYEVRLFGYPLLMRYKRGLLEDDIEAFENNYAYGILGTRVIARFPTQSDFYRELRAGTMAPIGLVKISDQDGFLRKRRVESNLPVFGYQIPDGEHAGKTAIIIYGLDGHRVYSEQMGREAMRFDQFEEILRSGGSMEQLVAAEDAEDLPPAAFEPKLSVGAGTVTDNFSNLLSDLSEYDRHVKFAKWNLARTPQEELVARKIAGALRARGVDVNPASSPLLEVDDTFGSFTYRKRIGGKWRLIRAVHFPSSQDIRKDIERRSDEAKAAHEKYGASPAD
jgi:hypothetical protein